MHEEYTPAVIRARKAADDWARKLSQPAAGPITLLLGLLDEEEGHAAQLLVRMGAAINKVRDRLVQIVPADQAVELDSVHAIAAQLARELSGERTTRSEHLLLAVLNASEPLQVALTELGIAVDKIESAIRSVAEGPLTLDEPLEFTPSPVEIDLARILDASANRAREALRVIEDYCRFALDDAFLSREAKSLRHDLVDSLLSISDRVFLSARDTLGDVGTTISTPAESQRQSPADVVRVNLKRLQEALRSLEEYGKIVRPELGSAMEKLRYRAYTLERSIQLRIANMSRLNDARLYLLVTGSACAASLEFVIEEAIAGGVDVVQLREKSLSDTELLQRARKVRRWTREAGAIFIVNDRPDIAVLAEADGVHLGQDDMPVRDARRILGPDALIGVSTHTIDQLHRAFREGESYVGIGPVFASPTKQFDGFPGLDFIRQASEESSLPAFALGGITLENVAQVIAAGAIRIAVSSVICGAHEPRPVAMALKQQLGS